MSDEPIDADADIVAGDAPPSTRQPLDRERIVTAAVDYIEEHGLPALTMRKLGQALGVEAMSLYRYVPGREDLLDAVVGHLMDQMCEDDLVQMSPENGWQDFMQRLAHGVRRTALAHPKCFPLVASRPPEAPWLRPPLRSLTWVEAFLEGLVQEGFSDDAAVAAYRGFSSFLLGHLLLEVSVLGADVGPMDVLEDTAEPDADELAAYPAVARLRTFLEQDQSAVEFEESLENLLDRITLLGVDHLG